MRIEIDKLESQAIIDLLEEHLRDMQATSPPESVHALDLEGLRAPEVTFWSAWDQTDLSGCGALKKLSPNEGEIKSMRTAKNYLRRGVASKILTTIITEARARKYKRLFLETGAQKEFESARALYLRFGFSYCPPFAEYVEDPNSVFMSLELQ